jgi:hypothetical protein
MPLSEAKALTVEPSEAAMCRNLNKLQAVIQRTEYSVWFIEAMGTILERCTTTHRKSAISFRLPDTKVSTKF